MSSESSEGRSFQTLSVAIPAGHDYPLMIGRDLLGRSDLWAQNLAGDQALVISDQNVAPLFLQVVIESLIRARPKLRLEQFVIEPGETSKSHDSLVKIYDLMLESGHNRDTTVVALGGGVVGDLAGFAAATYQRGVALIQAPTTLLAQVDSSVGGKTGINHSLGKNMIGAIYQPRCVIADLAALDSLPQREFIAGLAEVVKYALIRDRAFFDWLEEVMPALLKREPIILTEAIRRSCEHKAVIVAADEHERGQRALLNLGHTFAHAIETVTAYQDYLHGEAVAIGLVMAARFSQCLGDLSAVEERRIVSLLASCGLPIALPAEIDRERILAAMRLDKKNLSGRLRLVLLNGIGDACLREGIDEVQLLEMLKV